MSDLLRPEAKIYALRGEHPIEKHPLASKWNRSAEKITLSEQVATKLRLPSTTTVDKIIQAVKNSSLGYSR